MPFWPFVPLTSIGHFNVVLKVLIRIEKEDFTDCKRVDASAYCVPERSRFTVIGKVFSQEHPVGL